MMVAVGQAAAPGVTGPTESSSVPPLLPLWLLSEAARQEMRLWPMTAPSPASKKSSEESSSSPSPRVSPSPSSTTTSAITTSASPLSPPPPSPECLARRPRLPQDPTSIRGYRQHPTHDGSSSTMEKWREWFKVLE